MRKSGKILMRKSASTCSTRKRFCWVNMRDKTSRRAKEQASENWESEKNLRVWHLTSVWMWKWHNETEIKKKFKTWELGGKQTNNPRQGTLSYLSSGFSFSEAAVVAAGWFSPGTPEVDQETPAAEALQIKHTHTLVPTDPMVFLGWKHNTFAQRTVFSPLINRKLMKVTGSKKSSLVLKM